MSKACVAPAFLGCPAQDSLADVFALNPDHLTTRNDAMNMMLFVAVGVVDLNVGEPSGGELDFDLTF